MAYYTDKESEWKTDDLGNPTIVEPTTAKEKLASIGDSIKRSAQDHLGVSTIKTEVIADKLEAEEAGTTNNEYLAKLPTEERIDAMANSPEYHFNYDLAMKNGFTPTNILDSLAKGGKTMYQIDKAREAGLKDDDIVKHLNEKSKKLQKAYAKQKLGVFSHSDIAKGAFISLSRINALEHDGLHMIGLESSNENQQAISSLSNFVKSVEAGMADPDSIGKLTGEVILTAPTAGFNTAKWGITGLSAIMGLTSGLHGYGDGRLHGKDAGDSVKQGAFEGAVGAGLGVGLGLVGRGAMYGYNKIFSKMGDREKDRAIGMLADEYRLTTEEIEKTTEDYLKLNKPIDETFFPDKGYGAGTQILAVMNKHGVPNAKRAIGAMINETPELLTVLKKKRLDRINTIVDNTGKDTPHIVEVMEEVLYHSREIKDQYTGFINRIGRNNTYRKTYKFDMPELEDVHFTDPTTKSVYDNIAHTFKQGMTLSDLLAEYKKLNAHINTTSKNMGNKKYILSELKTKVDDTIAQSLDSSHYAEWKYVNSRYRTMAEFTRDTTLGKDIEKVIGGEITVNSLVKKMINGENGVKTFQGLSDLVGKEMIGKIEKAFINETIRNMGVDKDFSKLNYSVLSGSLSKKGFVSTEGRNYSNLIEHIKTQYSIDDYIKGLSLRHPDTHTDLGNRSADMGNKLSSYLLSAMVGSFTKGAEGIFGLGNKTNFNKTGKRLLTYETIEKALSTSGDYAMREIKNIIDEFPSHIIQQKMSNFYNDTRKSGINFVNTTTDVGKTDYTFPYLNNYKLKQASIVKFAQGMPLSPQDVNKLMNMDGKKITNIQQFANLLKRLKLDIFDKANVSPEDVAKAIHEHGLDLMFDGVKKATQTLDEPIKVFHYSSAKFKPDELKAGKQTKMLGKGTYFTDKEDIGNVAHKYQYSLPKGTRVLHIPDKESYETLLQNLGLKDRDNLNSILIDSSNVDVITVMHDGKKTINVLNEDLLESIRKGHYEYTPKSVPDQDDDLLLP